MTANNYIPFTLIYLVSEGRLLLIRRASSKRIQPNMIMPPGGKIEPFESAYDSAKREFAEETGLTLHDMELFGTFAWIDNHNTNGIFYIFRATKFTGKLLESSNEGVLMWIDCKHVLDLEYLAVHQKLILPNATDLNYRSVYNAFAIYKNDNLVDYIDSNNYYDSRKNGVDIFK